jgi:hypothetical protein
VWITPDLVDGLILLAAVMGLDPSKGDRYDRPRSPFFFEDAPDRGIGPGALWLNEWITKERRR